MICCTGQHFFKFKNGKCVVPVWELFQIERHWRKNINELCRKSNCYSQLHRKLNVFLFFVNTIRKRNIERNDVVSKIMIRENCKHKYCLNLWCFSVSETEYITSDKLLSYQTSRFL